MIGTVLIQQFFYNGIQETRLYATQHMRVFLRCIMPFFISWGMEMLITQLYDTDLEVANEAVDILDEACEEEVSKSSPLLGFYSATFTCVPGNFICRLFGTFY